MEAISRAVVAASTATASEDGRTSCVISTSLSVLLACLATAELRMSSTPSSSCTRPSPFLSEKAAGASPADVLAFLTVCAPHLPCSERPLSLFAVDHMCSHLADGSNARDVSSKTLGGVLQAVLEGASIYEPEEQSIKSSGRSRSSGTGMVDDGQKARVNRLFSEAVSSILVAHGGCGVDSERKSRPLLLVAALAISGVSRGEMSSKTLDGRRQDEIMVNASARALCVAATLVRAAAESEGHCTKTASQEVKSASDSVTANDLVTIFPVAILASACEDEVCPPCVEVIRLFGMTWYPGMITAASFAYREWYGDTNEAVMRH